MILSVFELSPCYVCRRLAEEEENERQLGVRTFEAQKWRQRHRECLALVAKFGRERVLE